MTARKSTAPNRKPLFKETEVMQKRNFRGIEQVIFAMTQKLQNEVNGPSNKGCQSLAMLMRALKGVEVSAVAVKEPDPTLDGNPEFYDAISE